MKRYGAKLHNTVNEKYMKIKFNFDDLPLKKPLELCDIIIVVRFVFSDDNNLYP